MKKIITYFFLGCFSYVVSSCSDLAFGDSFLEKAPGVDVTVDTIFSFKALCRPGIEFGLFHFAHGIDRTCK